jgi:hypothetical protein
VPATALDELDLVVGVPVRARSAAGLAAKEEDGDADVTLVGADEVVGAPAEGEIILPESQHAGSTVVVHWG